MSLNVFTYYVEQNQNPTYVEEYQSTSDKKSGKTFWHTNVNFRYLYTWIGNFTKFLAYNDKPRDEWEVYSDTGEQKAKHWTTRMQQSKIFKKSGNVYKVTAKGKAFGEFVELCDSRDCPFNDDEKWLLIYFFILNSYFDLKPNYILKKSKEVAGVISDNGINYDTFKAALENFLIKLPSLDKYKMFEQDAFWYVTFYKDADFLSLYKVATEGQKKLLFDRVINESKKDDSTDLLGHKFKNSGQYNLSMMADDIKTLYVTNEILRLNPTNPTEFFDRLIELMNRFSNVRREVLMPFFREHFDIFEIIFNEAILERNIDTELNETTVEENDGEEAPSEEKVDDTTSASNQSLRRTSQILKRMARERAQNRCELEAQNSCRYFTSKESNCNYLEIHHLIPFEFTNEFENSLEIIDNYVALCPHCHRLLHFGTDRERKAALTYLYNLRIAKLREHGLDLSLKQLLIYYGFEEEELRGM